MNEKFSILHEAKLSAVLKMCLFSLIFIDFGVDTAPPLHCALRDEVIEKELTVLTVSGQTYYP